MKVVVDINVLVSGLTNPDGYPGRIVDLLRVDALQSVVDDRILAGYHDVLARDAFRPYFAEQDRGEILEYLDNNALHIAPRFVLPRLLVLVSDCLEIAVSGLAIRQCVFSEQDLRERLEAAMVSARKSLPTNNRRSE